jgi:hypothetical protein
MIQPKRRLTVILWTPYPHLMRLRFVSKPPYLSEGLSQAVHSRADVGVSVPGKDSLRRKKRVTADRAGSRPTWVGLRRSRIAPYLGGVLATLCQKLVHNLLQLQQHTIFLITHARAFGWKVHI